MKRLLKKKSWAVPRGAKRVFRGKIFDVYQWKQKLFNGKYAIFERLKRPDTVSVIPVMDNGKIMIAREEQPGKKPFLTTLGGRVDKGESIRAAARRELLEETGYTAKKLFLWSSFQPYDKIRWTIYTFIAKGCRKIRDQHLDGGERIEPKFVTFDQLITLVLKGKVRSLELTHAVLKARINPKEMKRLRKLFSP
jgi:8-oxo-dGTP pyrophosphatase MutT (NUDIX family)